MGFPDEYQIDLHFYVPSATHMGDCAVCGNVADASVHDLRMLHRLAQAIAEQNVQSRDWRDHLKTARAALHVLRNPSKEMLDNQIDEVSWRRIVDRWLEGK